MSNRQLPTEGVHMTNDSTTAPARATTGDTPSTHAGPAATVVPTKTSYTKTDEEVLWDHLQRAETVATLLFFNFGGDGCFDDPEDAPGVKGMCAFVSLELRCAVLQLAHLRLDRPDIQQIGAIAEHMAALSNEELYGGKRGFRIGNQLVGMAYWSISEVARAAFEEMSGSHA